ncbi:hypothetical protein M426DRAFT_317127 [Hypoxylon sp. CI-4A]|nr:hypothetical protein M426DRAFT_317127 [Hypoxylon sp. CI-4A]
MDEEGDVLAQTWMMCLVHTIVFGYLPNLCFMHASCVINARATRGENEPKDGDGDGMGEARRDKTRR